MNDDLYKFPRLYLTADLTPGDMPLCDAHAHYLKNVLRHEDGDKVRFFNGRDGEWLSTLSMIGKRDIVARVEKQVRPQTARQRRVHLLFPPLKKDRMDTLVDMAVQLDVTDLHPVITSRTEVREIKTEKLEAQIRETAEQCERLDLPTLHPLLALDKALVKINVPVFAGLERSDAQNLRDSIVTKGDCAALVGPVGGWTNAERDRLTSDKNIIAVSLGANVLRCETAVASLLTRLAAV